ncbi:MAG: sigma-54-dependent transcriptional regulator [Desulfobacteraceae bacterium]
MDNEHCAILVVEDEEPALKNLTRILSKEGYRVTGTAEGRQALEYLATRSFDLVITDLRMQGVDGMEVLAETKKLQPYTEVIMITGYATVDSAVQAMKQGAYHYIAKPYKIDEIRRVSHEALLKRSLQLENAELREALRKSQDFPSIMGKSHAMRNVLDTVRQVAPSDANVLLLGESGTGKELVARAIHRLSSRSGKRFVAFNCGSFTEELMANELFGHEKGAYTGADAARKGLLESAHGGTVFLDEVGDMPLSMQVRLLRVIQEKEVLPVGGVRPVSVDLRFIAATHRDPKEEVKKGSFRRDLYYRLNVVTIPLPPLADREGDIPLLAHHFLAQKARDMNKDIKEIDWEAMELLCRYGWPGNVRELENVIERALALSTGPVIKAEHLPDYIQSLSVETYRCSPSQIPTLEEQEKRYISWVMERVGGNKTQAAKIMGIDRVSLWRKIKRYGLEEE